ncbi:hypothetical protein [Streptomyces sp. NPDC088115]|uniref:hypothetical protein n=1 Tax=Streptomyces sp. NPDC088115 TaxID=3365824 RepID=UPI0037F1DE7F
MGTDQQEDWLGIRLEEGVSVGEVKDLVLVVEGVEREATLDQVYSGEVQVVATQPDVGLYAGRITVNVFDKAEMQMALEGADSGAQGSMAGSISGHVGIGRDPSARPQPGGADRKVEIQNVDLSRGGDGRSYAAERVRLSGFRRRPDTGSEYTSSDEYWVTLNFHDLSILRLDSDGCEIRTRKRYYQER